MGEIWIAMSTFTAIVLTLVLIVTAAHRMLAPSGEVEVLVNGRRSLSVPAGQKLLRALAEQGIYLPAACGGRGSCGQCKVGILEGGRGPLPTEAAHISYREAGQGVRLACLFDVRDELKIRVPEDILDVRRWRCTVRSSRNISTFLRELVITLPEDERIEFEAGAYVLVEAPPHEVRFEDFGIEAEYRGEWARFQMLGLLSRVDEPATRAYSLANHPLESGIVMLVVRIATPPHDAPAGTPPGRVSSYLFSLEPGDELSVSGPFGEFRAQDSDREMVLIAGGAGIAPMRSIILEQLLSAKTQRKISLWYGARTLRELCYESEFDALARRFDNFSWHVALSAPLPEDAWEGETGFIHGVVYERYLREHPAPEEAEYYLCGPPLMSAAALHMLDEIGVEQDSIFLDDFGS